MENRNRNLHPTRKHASQTRTRRTLATRRCGNLRRRSLSREPDPEIYLATAKKLGVPAENCLAVEDSPTGFRAAHAAGCLTVLIPDLVAPTPDVLRDAASVHPNLSALREWLKNSFPQFSLP